MLCAAARTSEACQVTGIFRWSIGRVPLNGFCCNQAGRVRSCRPRARLGQIAAQRKSFAPCGQAHPSGGARAFSTCSADAKGRVRVDSISDSIRQSGFHPGLISGPPRLLQVESVPIAARRSQKCLQTGPKALRALGGRWRRSQRRACTQLARPRCALRHAGDLHQSHALAGPQMCAGDNFDSSGDGHDGMKCR